jgi:hypothetical protein
MASVAVQELKQKFAITPKTATFLVELGYTDYRQLRTVSPDQILGQLQTTLGWSKKQTECYRRPLRRMVWLATQEEPEKQAEQNPDWTQKALKAKGVWSDGFDLLTGDEIAQLLSNSLEGKSD